MKMKIRTPLACVVALIAVGFTVTPAARQLAGRSAEEWIKTLENPTRIAGLKIDDTIARLRLRPTDVVADIGAGSGIFEAALAKAVPQGKVYAVDIEQGLLDNIQRRTKEFSITNVQTVLGQFTDPKLPARDVDIAFIYDVLHHIQDRPAYLKSLVGYLEPSGRVAVIEFVPEKGGHRNQPELQITREQGDAMMAAAGLKPVEEVALFEDKWFVIYAKR
jgi:ubiquinone/menaquinone biosynthesis C-methylase UbiE